MKYLSKLLSMLLIGGMLFATGCTDYDQDIKNLQDEVENTMSEESIRTLVAGELEEVQTALQNAIDDANEAIDEMKDQLADLEEKHGDDIDELKSMIADGDEALAEDIADAEELIEQNIIDIADLKTRIATAESSINELKSDVVTLKTLIAAQDGRIEDLEEYKKTAEEQFDALNKSYTDLSTLCEATKKDLDDYKTEVADKFADAFGKIAENTQDIADLNAELTQKYETLLAADQAIYTHIAGVKSQLEGKYNDLATQFANKATELESKINALQTNFNNYKDETNAKIAEIEDDVKGAINRIENLEGKVAGLETLAGELEDAVAELETLLKTFEDRVNALLTRIQSIVLVPEYDDNEATINYAYFGSTIVEGRSTIEYQVYPAACAGVITKDMLSYDVVGVKTRSGETLQVVDVKGNSETGRLFVTVVARLGNEFYNNQKKDYAAALIYSSDIANLSTEFYGLYPGEASRITMDIVYKGEVVTGKFDVDPLTLSYTDVAENPDFVALPGYELQFHLDGENYTKAELAEFGYVVEPTFAWTNVSNEAKTVKSTVAMNETTGYNEINVDLEIDENLIGKTLNLVYTYGYGAGTLDAPIKAGSTLSITKEKATLHIEPEFLATWTYMPDAYVDAALLGDQVDDVAAPMYERIFGFKEADAKKSDNFEKVKLPLEQLFAMEPVEILVNGEAATVEQIGLTATGNVGEIYFGNFAWDTEYEVAVKYELSNVDVVVTFNVLTVDRVRKAILIDLGSKDWNYASNLQLDKQISDSLEGVINALTSNHTNLGGTTAEQYMLQNFVTKAYIAEQYTVNGNVAENSRLVISDDAKVIYTAYDYTDPSVVVNGLMSDVLKYSKKVTTWYGQEFEFVKTLNLVDPGYWFQHVPQYVYAGVNGFETDVQPWYNPDSNYNSQLNFFDVKQVDLNAAFDLTTDGVNFITIPVEGENRGYAVDDNNLLQAVFSLENTVKDIYKESTRKGILMYNNYISYYGKDDCVDVYATLYLVNDNGTKYKFQATNFDANFSEDVNDYSTYVVNKFDPIGLPKASDIEQLVDKVKVYDIDLTAAFSMKDVRGREMINRTRGAENNTQGDQFLVSGDNNNGFEFPLYSGSIYGYWTRNAQGEIEVEDQLVPVEINFSWELPAIAQQLYNKDLLKFHKDAGMIEFRYTSEVELKTPIVIPVTMKATTAWGEHMAVAYVTIKKDVAAVNE